MRRTLELSTRPGQRRPSGRIRRGWITRSGPVSELEVHGFSHPSFRNETGCAGASRPQPTTGEERSTIRRSRPSPAHPAPARATTEPSPGRNHHQTLRALGTGSSASSTAGCPINRSCQVLLTSVRSISYDNPGPETSRRDCWLTPQHISLHRSNSTDRLLLMLYDNLSGLLRVLVVGPLACIWLITIPRLTGKTHTRPAERLRLHRDRTPRRDLGHRGAEGYGRVV